jgi:hypothetical protein
MNPKAYGVIVQLALIFSALAIVLVGLIFQPTTSHDITVMLVGALCTAIGMVVTRARQDAAGGGDGGMGTSIRPPRMVDITNPPPAIKRAALGVVIAMAAVLLSTR